MDWANTDTPRRTNTIPVRRPRNQVVSNPEKKFRWEEQKKERTRILRELHDTLLQGILGAFMQLHAADGWLPADSPAEPIPSRALELMAQGIAEARAILQGLGSSHMPATSLEKALSELSAKLTPGDRARFRIVVMGPPKEFDSNIQEQVYLVAQEALINALRHSAATAIEIEVEYLPGKLRVAIRDNGCGIDPHALRSIWGSHRGLVGMRERAKSVGAQLRVWSRRGAGTELEITVPY